MPSGAEPLMSYEVRLSRAAAKQLARLPEDARERLLEELAEPRSGGR